MVLVLTGYHLWNTIAKGFGEHKHKTGGKDEGFRET
jgi:hypothetical protein